MQIYCCNKLYSKHLTIIYKITHKAITSFTTTNFSIYITSFLNNNNLLLLYPNNSILFAYFNNLVIPLICKLIIGICAKCFILLLYFHEVFAILTVLF